MSTYLILALVLLVVMAWLILRPFLEGTPVAVPADGTAARSATPPVVLPPKDLAARTAAKAVPVGAATVEATTPASSDDLRATVEAAIAARKAAMLRHSCDGCGASVDAGDTFCRACGTRVKEA